MEKGSLFVQGIAGTGKTTYCQGIVERLQAAGERRARGIAAGRAAAADVAGHHELGHRGRRGDHDQRTGAVEESCRGSLQLVGPPGVEGDVGEVLSRFQVLGFRFQEMVSETRHLTPDT